MFIVNLFTQQCHSCIGNITTSVYCLGSSLTKLCPGSTIILSEDINFVGQNCVAEGIGKIKKDLI
jgi:hypothetical protein